MSNYVVVTVKQKYEDPDMALDQAPDEIQTPGWPAKAWLVCAYSQYTEPVVIENWYLLADQTPLANIRLLHKCSASSLHNGTWRVNLPNNDYRHFNPPSTPQKVLRRDVPRPKTKVETRWHSGRWEKYLKAKGWVAA